MFVCTFTRKRTMEFNTHRVNDVLIAELIGDGIVVRSESDGTDLIGNVYYQGFDRVVVYQWQLTPEFFDLKTRLAGEILQKFSNYRVRLVIVGDLSGSVSRSLHEFIAESNQGTQANFLPSLDAALKALSQ